MSRRVAYSRPGRRWIAEVGNRVLVFNGRSFARFVKSAQAVSHEDIERVVLLVADAARAREEGATRLLTFLHLYLLVRTHDHGLSATELHRRQYGSVLGLLQALVADIPAVDPPETNWLLRYRKGDDPAGIWDGLEHRVTRSRTETGHDEPHVLAAWLAARELFNLALDERDAHRLLRSLTHYKHWISGPQSNLVTKGPLRRVVERDILRIAEVFPEFLESERGERQFLENWFLARFSLRYPVRLRFRRAWPLIERIVVAAFLVAAVTVILELSRVQVLRYVSEPAAIVAFVVILLVFAAYPPLFRLSYPRLFAGAVLGWSTLLSTIAGQVLMDPPSKPIVGSNLGSAGPFVVMLSVLGILLWFFLHHEVFSTIGSVWEAAKRSLLMLMWAFVLVAVVGLAAHVALDHLLETHNLDMRVRMALFFGGCAISLYVAVVAQLVWGDRGVSATLGGDSSPSMFEGG